MPDVRTLLDDATTRTPHPDPVTAVHRTVRRRAARRNTALVTGAVATVVAASAVTAAWPEREAVRPAITEGNVHFSPAWRAYSGVDGMVVIEDEPTYDRLTTLVGGNREAFVGVRQVHDSRARIHYEVAFSADADPAAWADELAAAAGDREVRTEQCDRSAAWLDRAATDVKSAPFPSGANVLLPHSLGWRVHYEFPCTVVAVLDRPPTAADHDYARDRWGGSVVLRSEDAAGHP